nr:type II toxin-antitoxin system VapC family toxin [Prosthecomicrobium hirschii]
MLDTHVMIWAAHNDPRLSPEARRIIAGADAVFVSSASLAEASIKIGIGKLVFDLAGFVAAAPAMRYRELPITWAHAAALGRLPAIHKDPFDRILIAQAFSDDLILLTADGVLPAYGSRIILV